MESDFSKYPRTKQIMDETGATIDEIYQIIEKIERGGENAVPVYSKQVFYEIIKELKNESKEKN